MPQYPGMCWRVIDGTRRLMSGLVIVLFAMMMAMVLIQVGSRYLMNYPTAWATELSTYCQVWLVLLGAGVAMARNQHMAIDMVPAMLPLNARRVASVLVALVTLGFLIVLAYSSFPLIELGAQQSSPALGMPLWIAYACLPLGAFYIALELIISVVRHWDDPFDTALQQSEQAPGDVS